MPLRWPIVGVHSAHGHADACSFRYYHGSPARGEIERLALERLASRTRGKLIRVLDMPLDILREVSKASSFLRLARFDLLTHLCKYCMHLQIKIILHLSKLSQGFRAFLTDQSMRPIWQSARLNVPGLPPCPIDLTAELTWRF